MNPPCKLNGQFPALDLPSLEDIPGVRTITFFDTFDPALFEDLKLVHEPTIGWPLTKEPKDPKAPKGTIAVARESLLTYDPSNDRHGGSILKTEKLPPRPGDSGVRIQVQCDILLEGYRPRRMAGEVSANGRAHPKFLMIYEDHFSKTHDS